MPITLITGPANAGKAGVVMDALRAHRARGRRPLLVVPTLADVERYRLELARAEPASEGRAGSARLEGQRRGGPAWSTFRVFSPRCSVEPAPPSARSAGWPANGRSPRCCAKRAKSVPAPVGVPAQASA